MIRTPRRATLIVNPVSGRARLLAASMPFIAQRLEANGLQVEVRQTTSDPASAEMFARTAGQDASLVIACGGDGTVHGVVQGLAGSKATLGVIPLGTANALARNLGMPLDPLSALERLLTYQPVRIPLGQACTAAAVRYFTVMAGCGPDGALVHALSGQAASRFKARFGRGTYYLQAAHLFATRSWPAFCVEYRTAGSARWQATEAAAVMAARVPDLGGAFSGITSRASLTSPSLHVQILRPPAHLSFPAWFTLTRLGFPNPYIETVEAAEVRCSASFNRLVYAPADAEPLGSNPLHLRIVPDALSLLMPAPAARSGRSRRSGGQHMTRLKPCP